MFSYIVFALQIGSMEIKIQDNAYNFTVRDYRKWQEYLKELPKSSNSSKGKYYLYGVQGSENPRESFETIYGSEIFEQRMRH